MGKEQQPHTTGELNDSAPPHSCVLAQVPCFTNVNYAKFDEQPFKYWVIFYNKLLENLLVFIRNGSLSGNQVGPFERSCTYIYYIIYVLHAHIVLPSLMLAIN